MQKQNHWQEGEPGFSGDYCGFGDLGNQIYENRNASIFAREWAALK
jgi:hypothetical protein